MIVSFFNAPQSAEDALLYVTTAQHHNPHFQEEILI